MADSSDIAALELQSDALAQSLGEASGMAASFESELSRVRDAFAATGKDVATLERGLKSGDITTKTDPVILARHLGMLLSGLLVRLRSDKSTAWHADTLKFVSALLD